MEHATRALIKRVAALSTAKGRSRAGMFVAEGTKCVLDTLAAFDLHQLIATEAWLAEHHGVVADDKVVVANRGEIGEMSSLTLPADVMAVYRLPEPLTYDPQALQGKLTIALDRVQDPGNLGTIMRTADWMGITSILASRDTVDCFNPKAIQATMGAISRVRIIYGDLPAMLAAAPVAVCGTFLDGSNIYTCELPDEAVVVMGNEGSGISAGVAEVVTQRLLIPSYPPERQTSESLNVATATAIAISQFISHKYGKGKV